MLCNEEYDGIKVLHTLSELLWFVQHHAVHEVAKSDKHQARLAFYQELTKNLEDAVTKLRILTFTQE